MRWLAVIVLGGAVLRVVGLDGQSFWRDEASTVMALDGGLGHLFDWIGEQEAQPPLHFVLAWLWSQPFGLGEVGLRSLSVLCGTATIPVAYAIGREHAERTGLLAAALVATNPWLVWYSQEARSYALLVLLTAIATLALLRDRRWTWAAAAAAALATHYFAAFLLIPQALILLRRRAWPALIAPAVIGAALLPLLVRQADGRVEGIERGTLLSRIEDMAKHWIAGPFGTPVDVLGLIALAVVVAGVALGARWWLLLVPSALAIAAPALLVPDHFSERYVVVALVPLLAVAAAGLHRPWPVAAGVAALFAGFTLNIAADEELHREDWRAVADGLGPAAVIVTADGERPLRVYAPETTVLTRDTADRVVFVASWRFGRDRPADPALPPGFTQTAREEGPTTTTITYEAAEPLPIDGDALALGWRLYNQPPVLLDVP